jgi:hypothetical protein
MSRFWLGHGFHTYLTLQLCWHLKQFNTIHHKLTISSGSRNKAIYLISRWVLLRNVIYIQYRLQNGTICSKWYAVNILKPRTIAQQSAANGLSTRVTGWQPWETFSSINRSSNTHSSDWSTALLGAAWLFHRLPKLLQERRRGEREGSKSEHRFAMHSHNNWM